MVARPRIPTPSRPLEPLEALSTSSMAPRKDTSRVTKRQRYGCTPLQDYRICLAHNEPKNAGNILEDFHKQFPRLDGSFIPISTPSNILSQKAVILARGPPTGPGAVKMKQRKESFPILERFLTEWMESAMEEKLKLSDDIIIEAA